MTNADVATLRQAAALLAGDQNKALRATFLQRAADLAAGRPVPGLARLLSEAETVILLLGD